MNAGKYWLLMFLATVIAILIILEIVCEIQVANLTAAVSTNEARVAQAQRQSEQLRQLVQRTAVLSQHDQALLDLLSKRGIRVTARNNAPNAPAEPTSVISPVSPTSTPSPAKP